MRLRRWRNVSSVGECRSGGRQLRPPRQRVWRDRPRLSEANPHGRQHRNHPPYNAAEGFVRSGVTHSRRKFALLLRLAFLEGVNRANTIFARIPPSRVWVFSERITFYPRGAIQKTAYAWFVWDKDAPSGTELKWFKPGYKAAESTLLMLDMPAAEPVAGQLANS